MKLPDSIQTVNQEAEATYQERSSRFIAIAGPVQDETEARSKRDDLRKAHHKAVHVVMAYRLGHQQPIEFSTDDGEPSGSAGRPVLNELRSRNLSNTAVWVVRYYGGKKLGVPGLIQAYKQACSDALDLAGTIPLEHRIWYLIQVPAAEQHQVANLISGSSARIEEAHYDETTTFKISINEQEKEVVQRLTEHWQMVVDRLPDPD